MFNIALKQSAAKSLKRLPLNYKSKIIECLHHLSEDPFPEGYDLKKLSGFKDFFRIRLGKYRIVYSVDLDNMVITIWFIGHRSKAYKGKR